MLEDVRVARHVALCEGPHLLGTFRCQSAGLRASGQPALAFQAQQRLGLEDKEKEINLCRRLLHIGNEKVKIGI